jgi:hypothetical protein
MIRSTIKSTAALTVEALVAHERAPRVEAQREADRGT